MSRDVRGTSRFSPITSHCKTPEAAPIFYALDHNGQYDIHIDNTGRGLADLTFRSRFTNTYKKLTVPSR